MYITGLGISEEDRMKNMEEQHIRRCEKDKEYLMNYSMCFLIYPKMNLNPLMTSPRSYGRIYA